MPDLAVDGTPLWGDPPYETTMDRDLRRLYGMRLDHYDLLLARQGGVCAICKRPPLAGKRLVVDEDHSTRMIRGLLCARDNRLTTEAREAYLADPPAAPLGWYVPEKQWDVRQARNASRARRHQEAKAAAKVSEKRNDPVFGQPTSTSPLREYLARAGIPSAGVTAAAIERMEQEHQSDHERALAESAAWSGGHVDMPPDPPREEAPTRRRGLLGRLFG